VLPAVRPGVRDAGADGAQRWVPSHSLAPQSLPRTCMRT
jgi:hypothetical protein